MTETTRRRWWFPFISALVLALGWLEGWYGPTVAGDVYGSDAVQYLDIARAFERGDLHSALNPIWSQGYPALLALVRPLFAPGLEGEWNSIRGLNFAIFVFCWLAFAALVREVFRTRETTTLAGAAFVFLTAQVCIDQVSRVGPDQLVAAIFFLVCTLLLRLARRPERHTGAALGLALGLGFLVKAIFLPLGFIAILVAFVRLRRLQLITPAATVFAGIVLVYGAALSHETGTPTLGEAGSLNYAWHVDRLAKWVHWEGGADPADKAWPKPWIARFTHWQTDPPDFGRPIHPSELLGTRPTIFAFRGPVVATYTPYFDPPYWYAGYRHVTRWRYQVVALGKNVGDLAQVILKQPLFLALGLAFAIGYKARRRLPAEVWPVAALALAGVAIYLPVHLEGRYLSAFLAVLALLLLEVIPRRRLILAMLTLGFVAGLVKDQRVAWSRAIHRWNYRDTLEWREGQAVAGAGLAPGSEIGVISWTPNVQCDWAYLAGVRITSEIASAADENIFWQMSLLDQNTVMLRFRQAGAAAVVTRDKPADGVAGWEQVGSVPMWIYRF
jgi:4-amino-4-deoxy-L-arabinose transferase-like glycosyltransferase